MAAIRQGITFKELVTDALEHEIGAGARRGDQRALKFPLVTSRKPAAYDFSPDQIADILIREEAAAYETTQRR